MEILTKLIGFIFFFAAVIGVYYLVKGKGRVLHLGSWSNLERDFGTDRKMPANYFVTSAMIGSGRYRGTFKVSLGEDGVYLDTPSIAKIGSKILLIPYHEFTLPVSNQTVSWGFQTLTQLIVRGQSVCLSPDIAKKILDRKK